MIDDYAFYNNQWITEYTFGNIYNLTYIGGYSFYQNLSLVEFFIPDTITYIGANAFYANHDLVLNCEPISQPALWDINWNANGATTVNWAVNHRTITLVLDNGEADILIFQKIGTIVTQPTAPTKAGWDFDGWYIYDGVDFIPYSFTTMPEEDLTVYALYTPL